VATLGRWLPALKARWNNGPPLPYRLAQILVEV
jgi:hypothetical protein